MRESYDNVEPTEGEIIAGGMQEELHGRAQDVVRAMGYCPRCGQPLTGSHCDTCSG